MRQWVDIVKVQKEKKKKDQTRSLYPARLSLKMREREFPDGPDVKTLPSNTGGQVRSLVGELRSHMPRGQKTRT